MKTTTVGLAVAATLLWIATAFPVTAASADSPKSVLAGAGIDPRIGKTLALQAVFVDDEGDPTTLHDAVAERPAIVCPVYFRCPMLCKLSAKGLAQALAEIEPTVGEDFDVLLVSFDPRDDLEAARAAKRELVQRYGRPGSEAGWRCLTGKQEAIDAFTESIGFRYAWDDSTEQFAHASGVIFVSRGGRISGYLDGVKYDPAEVAAALAIAAQGGVSPTPPPSIFVRCYLYDPQSGGPGVAVFWTLRALCVATLFGMIVGFVRLSRRHASAPATSEER
jgi:protein SCO1/2